MRLDFWTKHINAIAVILFYDACVALPNFMRKKVKILVYWFAYMEMSHAIKIRENSFGEESLLAMHVSTETKKRNTPKSFPVEQPIFMKILCNLFPFYVYAVMI